MHLNSALHLLRQLLFLCLKKIIESESMTVKVRDHKQAKDQTEARKFKIVSVKCAYHQVKRLLLNSAKKLGQAFPSHDSILRKHGHIHKSFFKKELINLREKEGVGRYLKEERKVREMM